MNISSDLDLKSEEKESGARWNAQ